MDPLFKVVDLDQIKEIPLKKYLMKFDREGASLDVLMASVENTDREVIDIEEDLALLRRLRLDWLDLREILEEKKERRERQPKLAYRFIPPFTSALLTLFTFLSQ